MKIVVVGATGNVGSALLRRLRGDPVGDDLHAVARRVPRNPPPPPFDAVSAWTACDVGAPGAQTDLTDAFAGADCVVHLAWAIQPSHDRERLRATNVLGTRAVLEAATRARVPHLVVASSIGAYAPVPQGDDSPRDELWPATGIASSSYSSDKAEVESMLDEAESGPVRIARLRTALVFQRRAGAEIGRLFLGPLFPKRLIGGPLPFLPWPRAVRFQVVHADDAALAYRQAIVRRAVGPFNVAADGVLTGGDVARLLRAAALVELPRPLVRAVLLAAWQARAAVVGPGWLDMACGAPVLDTSRALDELGWRPLRTAEAVVAEAVRGLRDGVGAASPPLRPRARLVRPSPAAG